MKYLLPCILLLVLGFTLAPQSAAEVDEQTPIYQVLRALGAGERADIMVRPVPGASAELGERLVLEGIGSGGGRQSVHFKCTSCHNVVREDPVLNNPDPSARLAYAEAQDLPFLPGTTLWGAINRESYYNGDYDKKYGDLVKAARRDLRGAIQLCATECAQGDALNEVEMESVIAYLHTLSLTLEDVGPAAPPLDRINKAINSPEDEMRRETIIRDLRRNYLVASPATFLLPPEDRRAGYAGTEPGDPERGSIIYDRACLHCHDNQRYSFFELGESQDHYAFMTKHFPRYTRYSTYQVSRYGTSPIPGKRAYMPHYTAERMTNQQIEDLRAYLALAAAK